MSEFKGLTVPDVGEFVSEEIDLYLAGDYCHKASILDCFDEKNLKCEKCLFNKPSAELTEWHNKRKQEQGK